MKCRICGAIGAHRRYRAREMMFGTREEFEYFQCTDCGCLQLAEIPSRLDKFYPPNYYSFNLATDTNSGSPLDEFLQKQRCRNAMFRRGYKLDQILRHIVKLPPQLYSVGPVIRRSGITSFKDSFLDVGCGSWSSWLNDLKKVGFRKLIGVDPYICRDVRKDGICIFKKHISELSGQFSLITFHHSFEHMPEQLETLLEVKRLLASQGTCLIRIPIVSSDVWKKYVTNWVEMDPPRHLYLHSNKSIELLGNKAGFDLYDVVYDSSEFEFYGSEQYVQDIPLIAENSYWVNPTDSVFAPEQIKHFKAMAKKVNQEKVGGRAGFYFKIKS